MTRQSILRNIEMIERLIARSTGLPTLVDPYSARIAMALGDVVARPLKQEIHYPIAIISRGPGTLTLAASLFAQALIPQFGNVS